MGKIQVLDEQLANQIAAGEVVERPSSVVKELVENAIDAGSSTIDVVIEEGGLTLIRVTDNGQGIDAEDIGTAFFRHATSKIASSKDLFRIASLGFRGEALPSIAAVARVECVSSSETTGLGRRYVIEGGVVKKDEEANAPQGTDVSVRDLFFNTPARLKYMKTIQTEIGHIADYVNRLALAHPGIAFTLRHNNSQLLRTIGNGDRVQAFAAIYGTSAAKAMLPVEGEHPDYDLSGYISKPEQTRANRNGITVVVNGRYIRSFVINQAIMQAYHTLLPINRYPLVVLELGMHPSLLDVNVHPSKMEVRFSKEAELREFVEQSLAKALGKQRHIPGPAASERSKPLFVQDRISFHQAEPNMTMPPSAAPSLSQSLTPLTKSFSAPSNTVPSGGSGAAGKREGKPSYTPDWQSNRDVIPKDATELLYAPPKQPAHSASGADVVRETAAGQSQDSMGHTSAGSENNGAGSEANDAAAQQEARQADHEPINSSNREEELVNDSNHSFPELYWIGQLHGTYIVAQNEEGLYLIDQHAAHERINYEYYVEKFGRPQQASQQLLVPITLEFTASEASTLRGRLPLIEEAGIELEPFGPQTFLVRAYPEWLPQGDEQAVIEEMMEWLLGERGAVDIGKLREKSAIMCSCKASIKANDRLTREEGEGLLQRLSRCIQPYTCPHGRPILVHMSTYQLEKMFKRVMS
ncbi:DNA mismatch repair protein MutL [Paenibacillus plantiphilus]|uniref:DNA mismatch repair protein MutL n=1 Tax=Paenibacillus plantiphilus TaxID=2905650 RepID=A0ABM9BW86_9BACL|nr:DNA mismatch repair endonuclease MutL [Paenibacillus plantiphilus]CAH1195128.1 DNA mismatch repair protein MutL [Paenibacillus plantiphilus]